MKFKFNVGERVHVVYSREGDCLGWWLDYGPSITGEIIDREHDRRVLGNIYKVRVDDYVENTHGSAWWCYEHWIEPNSGPW